MGEVAILRQSDSLTFLFDDDASFESHHYAFHVSDAEFDSIFERVKQAGLAYGSAPWSFDAWRLFCCPHALHAAHYSGRHGGRAAQKSKSLRLTRHLE